SADPPSVLARTIAWTRRRRPASEAITGGMVSDIFPQPYAEPFARQGAYLPENDDRHRSPRRRHDVHGDGLHHLREPADPRIRRRPRARGQGLAVRSDADRDV